MSAEQERQFGNEELFFSTTDRKGIIESGNRVFERVAAYSEEEMLGKAHNLVRHPDQPRCVFQLLWDTLAQGKTIAAYVKNRAKTGESYWVMATVAPCDGGYLSVRLKPSTPIFDAVKEIYEELRAIELELGGEGEVNRKEAMEASGQRLAEILGGMGFPDYWSFMHTALSAELASRAALMRKGNLLSAAERPTAALPGTPLGKVREACGVISSAFDEIFGANLDGFDELARQLGTKSTYMLELADAIRLFSFNALLAATRLGSDGVTLGAVADLMGTRSVQIGDLIHELSAEVGGTTSFLGEVGFGLSVARLRNEMAMLFVDELAALEAAGARDDDALRRERRFSDIGRLAGCLDDSLETLFAAVAGVDERVSKLAKRVGTLQKGLEVMGVLEVNGRIEAAHAPEAGGVVSLFTEIGQKISEAREELAGFSAAAATSRGAGSKAALHSVAANLKSIRGCTDQLAA